MIWAFWFKSSSRPKARAEDDKVFGSLAYSLGLGYCGVQQDSWTKGSGKSGLDNVLTL